MVTTKKDNEKEKECSMPVVDVKKILAEDDKEDKKEIDKEAKKEKKAEVKVTENEVEKKLLELAGIDNPQDIFSPKTQANFFSRVRPLYYDKAQLWWMWDDEYKKWEIHDEVDILNEIEEKTGQDIITPKNRTLIINALKQICRKNAPKEVKPTWIQFKEEIVDIASGEVFPATSEYFVTNPLPWSMARSDKTPNMDKIFEEWVGKEYVQTLYEILAYSTLPSYPIHRLFCLIGAGLNGKSCYLRVIKKFLGKDNCSATELERLMVSRFEVTQLYKKLVCLLGETNFTEMKQTALIKSLTGGDAVTFEHKGKMPFIDTNYAKIVIATNNLPSTTDKTLGWYRRWCIIDFPNQFTEAKDILADIPETEYEALARKCFKILKALLERRAFHNEGSIEERMAKYEARSDFLQNFIDTYCDVDDPNGYITKGDFFKKFCAWCDENRHRSMSDVSLGIAMKKHGFDAGTKSFSWMHEGAGGTAKVWLGIKWKV